MLETVACISKITNCCESVSKNNQNMTDQCPSGVGGKNVGVEQNRAICPVKSGGVGWIKEISSKVTIKMFAIFVNQVYRYLQVNYIRSMFCVKIFWSIVRTVLLTTSIDSPKLSSTSLETIFFTFWEVSVADCDGVLSKPVNYEKK